jgi:hypothetical protein
MKQYFAKYLPVEGEIKEGDIVIGMDGIFEYKGKMNLPDVQLPKKVKLFLCSRNIQVGDKVLDIRTNTWKEVNNSCGVELYKQKPNDIQFKVIGEISPNAKWVKEGDEFEENDWDYSEEEDDKGEKVIKIGCPCCGDFK